MENYLFVFILIPAIGFLINAIANPENERLMARSSYLTMVAQFITTIGFVAWWLIEKSNVITGDLELVDAKDVHFYFDYCFNWVTVTYLLVGSFLSLLIIAFSRTYLHREGGFKRFFTTIMLFYLAYNILVLSGNLATLFIGWEIAGISSFLLIGYYRVRYIPVRNAVKVFSIYRIGDMALILALWISHHFYDHNIMASEFDVDHPIHIHAHSAWVIFFSAMILIAASIKSAQFPFSSWLPRAMEGPTPSSAIFYSSLAVHLGVLLLLRTYTFWSHHDMVKLAIIGVGGITFFLASIIAFVQSSIKAQIAYGSVAQIGLMFIEVALGWHVLALIHFTGNALLRSYQILVSPSIVTYLIREKFYTFNPQNQKRDNKLSNRIGKTIYLLGMEEFFMDGMMHHAIWNLLKRIGKKLRFMSLSANLILGLSLFIAYGILMQTYPTISIKYRYYLSIIPLLVGVSAALRSFIEKKNVFYTWLLVLLAHTSIMLTVYTLDDPRVIHVALYAGGLFISTLAGFWVLYDMQNKQIELNLNWYQGHAYDLPKHNLIFLLASLGLFGFPITSTFLGIEEMVNYIHTSQPLILFFIILILLVNSLSVIRMYSRIFLGPHNKTYHEISRRSS